MRLYAIQQNTPGNRWTRAGVGGELMLTERGANGQVFRPVIVNGRPDRNSEALLHNRLGDDFDAADRVQASQVMGAYLGRPVRVVEIVGVHCDPQRKRQDPPDPWWAAARASTPPAVEDDRIAFFLSDPRPTGFECTAEEAAAVMAWAESLPGWARVSRPMRVERGFVGRKRRTRRYVGWDGPQIRVEDAG